MSSIGMNDKARQRFRSDESTRLSAEALAVVAGALETSNFDRLEPAYSAGRATDQNTMVLTLNDGRGRHQVSIYGPELLARRRATGDTASPGAAEARRFLEVVVAILQVVKSPIPDQTSDVYEALVQTADWSLKLEYSQPDMRNTKGRNWGVRVDSNGLVDWGGLDVPLHAETALGAEDLVALHNTLRAARLDQLAPEYAGNVDHRAWTTLTLLEDGKSHRVRFWGVDSYAEGARNQSDDPEAGKRFLEVVVAILDAVHYPQDDDFLRRCKQILRDN